MLRDQYGFEPGSMICLIDEDPNAPAAKLPTGANIKNNLKQLVAASQPGDVLFFHFSGHGTQVRHRDLGQRMCPRPQPAGCACASAKPATTPIRQ